MSFKTQNYEKISKGEGTRLINLLRIHMDFDRIQNQPSEDNLQPILFALEFNPFIQ